MNTTTPRSNPCRIRSHGLFHLEVRCVAATRRRPPQVHSRRRSHRASEVTTPAAGFSLFGAVDSLFRLAHLDFLLVLLFSKEGDLGQEDKHVIDRAVAP